MEEKGGQVNISTKGWWRHWQGKEKMQEGEINVKDTIWEAREGWRVKGRIIV